MAEVLFRRATEADGEALLEILRAAFKVQEEAALERLRRMVVESWQELVVLTSDGQPVAVAHVEPHRLRVGSCSVLKADVGHVGVRPDLQGSGLGTRLLQEIVAWLPEQRFHVSRLGGLMLFYQRFGYEPFPRRYVTIPVPARETEVKGKRWNDLLALTPESAAAVRSYHPSHDHRQAHRLRCVASMRPGALVLPTQAGPSPAGGPDPSRPLFVYERRGEIVGYLRGALARVHAGDLQPRYCLDELAVAGWETEVVGALVKTLMAKAVDLGPTEIMARLPYDEQLFDALTAAGIPFNVLEMHQALDGNMMQVVDLHGVLRAIAPELSRRLKLAKCCPWKGQVAIRLPRQSAILRVAPDGITALPSSRTKAVAIDLSHTTFLKALFGIQGLTETAAVAALAGPAQVTLGILFPRLPAASGPWG